MCKETRKINTKILMLIFAERYKFHFVYMFLRFYNAHIS